jgi:hypothetical protein
MYFLDIWVKYAETSDADHKKRLKLIFPEPDGSSRSPKLRWVAS